MCEMSRCLTVVALMSMSVLAMVGCDGNSGDGGGAVRVKIRRATWFVDLAMTQDSRYTGLSGRRAVASDVGMLFVYPQQQVLEFCMRDCHIPLDIAFLDSDRRVVAMHTMLVEADLSGQVTYSSGVAAQYALEVAAGGLARAGVRIGDTAAFIGDLPPAAKAEPPAGR